MNSRILHNKLIALTLAALGFVYILYKLANQETVCEPGQSCKPHADWRLKPYNGLDEDSPIRRRFLEEAANERDSYKERHNDESANERDSYNQRGEEKELLDLFDANNEEPRVEQRIVTKTEVKVKEVFIAQPCETELDRKWTHIRNCVTNQIIGKIPRDLELVPFDGRLDASFIEQGTQETVRERARSFSQVYRTSAWGKNWDPGYRDLNGSGRGATLSWTQELTATLHVVINMIKAELGLERVRVLDVPCGDMAWMSRFLLTRDDIDYTGIDIVPELIEHHQRAYQQFPWKFMKTDVIGSGLNQSYDLILCRMLLQHLYFRDVTSLLDRFSRSNSSFLLTTTFLGNQANTELVQDADNPGRVRKLNLEIPPLSLSPPFCYQRDGPRGDFEGWTHFVGLWKLPLTRVRGCQGQQVHSMTYPGYKKVKMYSCTQWGL